MKIEMLEQVKSKMDFNVTRCVMLKCVKNAPWGNWSFTDCSRDSDFCTGYNPDIYFERNKRIMKSASNCEFRLNINTIAKISLNYR